MATLTRPTHSDTADDTIPSRRPGPIIVATDGTPSADAAFVAARLIHTRTGLPVQVLSVLDPFPLFVQPLGLPTPPPNPDVVRVQLQKDCVQRQLRATDGENSAWLVEVRLGRPAVDIALTAKRRHAELVITGMNRHGVIDRLLGNETPIHIAQLGDTPLLATVTGFERLPRQVIIATDLYSPALDRLQEDSAVRALLAEVESVYCMHVVPEMETWGPDNSYWDRAYGQAVHEAFAHLKESLQLPRDVHMEKITPTGDPARQILDFAAFAKVELIIAGRREATMLERRVAGGVAAKLLRGATCSVLLLPPVKIPAAVRRAPLLPGGTETVSEPRLWPNRLMDFTRRNSGRRASLEIDDIEIGAQTHVAAYPFLGVDYDHKNGRIEIMMGESGPSGRHLMHGIPRPGSLDILVGADGREQTLRIAYTGGQALLTFDG